MKTSIIEWNDACEFPIRNKNNTDVSVYVLDDLGNRCYYSFSEKKWYIDGDIFLSHDKIKSWYYIPICS